MRQKIIIQKTHGTTIYADMCSHRVTHVFTDEYYCPRTGDVFDVPGKGAITNQLSGLLFRQLKQWDVPTHFIKMENMRTSCMLKTSSLPFKLRVYCAVDQDMASVLSVPQGMTFSPFLVEYKGLSAGYHLNDDFLVAMNWIGREELEEVMSLVLRCGHNLQGFFSALNFQLMHAEFTLGYSEEDDMLLLVGPLCPETLCLRRQSDGMLMGCNYLHKDPVAQYGLFASSVLGKIQGLSRDQNGEYDVSLLTPKASNENQGENDVGLEVENPEDILEGEIGGERKIGGDSSFPSDPTCSGGPNGDFNESKNPSNDLADE